MNWFILLLVKIILVLSDHEQKNFIGWKETIEIECKIQNLVIQNTLIINRNYSVKYTFNLNYIT